MIIVKISLFAELCKISSKALSGCLAEQSDIDEVISLYLEYFEIPGSADDCALDEQTATLGFKFAEADDKADTGVEVEANMSSSQLAANLDFKNLLPAYFNTHRHNRGCTSWDHPQLFEKEAITTNPDMSPLTLYWHQLAGVHAIIRMNFSKEANPGATCGVLLADEVGIGKTYQAAATIGSVSDLLRRQELGKEMPPIISKITSNHHPRTSLT